MLLSEYVPVALNCCAAPTPIDGLAGVTANDTNGALVTVSVAVPLIPLSVAVISDEPAVLPVANPPLIIVATDRLPEDQLT